MAGTSATTPNLALKYAQMIDERFSAGSITDKAVNKDYDFVGVQTVRVFGVNTAQMNDYQRSGSNRYGTPEELDNTVQELTMKKDKSFTFTVDKMNDEESGGSLNAGKALRRQQDEEIIPMIDKYRLSVMVAHAGHVELGSYTGDTKPYERLLVANQYLDDRSVPRDGRVAFVTGTFRTKLRLDNGFIEAAKIDPATRIKGQIGEADSTPIVSVPSNYLPDGVELVIAHPKATTAPQKLADYKTHIDPPGISGVLCEGRVVFDAFVLDNKKDALYALRTAPATLEASCEGGSTSAKTVLSVTGQTYEDGQAIGTLVYKTASGQTAPALGDDLSAWTGLTLTDGAAELSVTSGHKIVAACRDINGKCVATSAAVTVVVGG